MDIREYIESGVIELYVMNTLTEAEAAELEALALQHPEIQSEIKEVQSVMQLYAQAHAQTPNPDLKGKILEKIKDEYNKEEREAEIDLSDTAQINTIGKTGSAFSLSTVFPWLIAAGTIISSIYFYQKYQETIKSKTECEAAQALNEQKNKKAIAALNFKLDVIKSPDTKTIILKSVIKTEKDLEATVYWSASKNATYLAIRNLPEPPADKQYQLWAIVDKKPVDAGVFEYNLSEIQSMKVFEEAQAFAVTLEPEGGSKSPTLEKMYVLGTL